MFKKYFEILANPLLYYVDEAGNGIFRNFTLFKETGNMYRKSIPKANAGNALEYRMKLDGYLKLGYFLATIILYLIFIHLKFSIFTLLFFEVIWVLALTSIRMVCAYKYQDYLIKCFGKYEIVEFNPHIAQRKKDEFAALYRSKIILTLIAIAIFLTPSVFLKYGMKLNLTKQHKNYKPAIVMSNIYNTFYPKDAIIYDMRAAAHFMQRDFENALKDYKTALDLSGKDFTKRDVVRFENLLLAQKRVAAPQDAVDLFNEYVTKKKMTVLEESQMLWIKSIFKIENNITETIMQEYNDLLSSLDEKDYKNKFYISCDKAYMMYLMRNYENALNAYDVLITYAQSNQKTFYEQIPSLYAERGWTKTRLGDNTGANIDFKTSQIDSNELQKYEPSYTNQGFVMEKF